MSFTLMRYKDGKEVPIKVSILDAFRSAPPRRLKAVQPEKKPENKSSPVDEESNSKTTNDDNVNKDSSNSKNFSNHEEETYTAGDDAKIIAMKGENKSWKQIMEATGKKSESQLKNHYKLHLGPNAKEEQQKVADKLAKAEKNKAEGLAEQTDGEEKKEDGGGGDGGKKGGGGGGGKKNAGGDGNGGGGGGKKNKGKEKAKAQEESKEGKDTPEALTKQNLKTFVAKYERDKWLAAASRHYDLTGQRISPEAAKRMADGK